MSLLDPLLYNKLTTLFQKYCGTNWKLKSKILHRIYIVHFLFIQEIRLVLPRSKSHIPLLFICLLKTDRDNAFCAVHWQFILTCGRTHIFVDTTTCDYALSMHCTKCIVPSKTNLEKQCIWSILTTEEYNVFQYSARCDSNLLRKRVSKLEAILFAIHAAGRGGWDILRTVGCRTNRVPKSLVKSTGLES